MHSIVPDICNQNGYFTLVTLQWFKCSANSNGRTLVTEKSQTFKNYLTHFYRLYSRMTGSKIIAGSPSKMAPNFKAVLSVLLQICGQICRIRTYPCIFVEEVVSSLWEMTDKLVLTFVCGRN